MISISITVTIRMYNLVTTLLKGRLQGNKGKRQTEKMLLSWLLHTFIRHKDRQYKN